MKSLLIIGAGGHGHVVAEIAEACGFHTSFVDDSSREAVGSLGQLEELLPHFDLCIVAIGDNYLRQQLTGQIHGWGGRFATLIHPTAFIAPSALIGEGTVVEPQAIVNSHSFVGMGCIISVGCIIDHNVKIGDFAHVNAGAICKAGSCVASGHKVEAGVTVEDKCSYV